MAYFNLLASVSEKEVEQLQNDPSVVLRPSLVLGASHLLAYWIETQPLSERLRIALDGGETIHTSLWHPLRPPLFHRPAAVRDLATSIAEAWQAAIQREPLPDKDWLSGEMARLTRLFSHAADHSECVVSVLDRPGDDERGRRVRILWAAQWDGELPPTVTSR